MRTWTCALPRLLASQGTDLEALQIWHGQSVRLGLEAGAQRFKYEFVVQSEPEWRRLAEVLPTAQVRV